MPKLYFSLYGMYQEDSKRRLREKKMFSGLKEKKSFTFKALITVTYGLQTKVKESNENNTLPQNIFMEKSN